MSQRTILPILDSVLASGSEVPMSQQRWVQLAVLMAALVLMVIQGL